VDQRVDVTLENRRELLGVGQGDEVLHDQVLLRRLGRAHDAGSQQARSSIMLCGSARHRGCTRMPVDILSMLPASPACPMAVAAPSGVTSASANGRSSGCFGVGCSTHVHDATVPIGPTSTRSSSASPVFGSYSSGGTSTLPFVARTPRILCSRSP